MKKTAVFLVVGFCLSSLSARLFAQDTLWTRTYGGDRNDIAYSVRQTGDEGYILAGMTASFGEGDFDLWVVKTNALGNSLWTRYYGGGGDDAAHSVELTSDGGYVLAGYTAGQGSYDAYLVKTDGSGDTLWTRAIGGEQDDAGWSVMETADGAYIVAGYTRSYGAGDADFLLLKTSASGIPRWFRTYGGANDDRARSLDLTSDGGYILAGETNSYGAGSYDFYVVKTDSLGDTLWTRTYGSHFADRARCIRQTWDGGYIISGHSYSFDAASYDVHLIKTDAGGEIEWDRTYGTYRDDYGYSVQQTTDGGYVVIGQTYTTTGGDDLYIVKTNADGDTSWTRTYGGLYADAAYSVQQTTDGGYVAAGVTMSFGAGEQDFWLVKLGAATGLSDDGNAAPGDFRIVGVAPDPFNARTRISYSVAQPGEVTLSIYDIRGRRVHETARSHSAAGEYSLIWDAEDFASGVYFARLTQANHSQSRKMVLVK